MDNFDLKKYLAEGKLQNKQTDLTENNTKLLISDLRNTIYDFDNERLTAQEFRDEITTILYDFEAKMPS